MVRILALWLVVACGGGSEGDGADDPTQASTEVETDGPLDCEWLAEPDNCWATTHDAAIDACEPPEEEGMLSADHSLCTFSDGTTITFDEPLNLEGDSGPDDIDLTITSGTSTCRFVSNVDAVALTVDDQTAANTYDGFTSYMECPDGSVYGPADAFDLLECDWNNLPGSIYSWTSTSITFGLLGEEALTFSCAE